MPIDRSLLESMIMQGLMPDNQTQLTFKEDGTVSYTRKPFAEPKGEKPKGEGQPTEGGSQPTNRGENIPTDRGAIPQSALARYLAPFAGPAASSLRGLMPEQVMAVINAQRAAGETRGRTIGQLMQAPLQQAQIEKIRTDIAAAQAPPAPPTRLEEARAGLAERRTEVLEPTTPPLTFKERMELKRTAAEISRGDYWRNPETQDIKFVEKGEDPPKGYTDMVSAERAPKETVWKKTLPLSAYETMVGFLVDKEGDLLDVPDLTGLDSINATLIPEGLEIVEVPIESLKRAGWLGIDLFKKDMPGRNIYVITEAGKSPTREEVMNALTSLYGYTPEEAERFKVEK